ncbi:hypothetical protein [Streptomyces sp. NPDC055912]|uniref:hypothetical protein n=1 Tax=Streptomyces sp. NPDC055912 TaxID=3345660 RepID=UPI0035D7FA68
MVKPTQFLPDADDDQAVAEVDKTEVRRRARQATAPDMTRRSWYVTIEAADAFTAAVDDIHFATRLPKHQVVSALMEAAAAQAPRIQARLAKQAGLPSQTSHP